MEDLCVSMQSSPSPSPWYLRQAQRYRSSPSPPPCNGTSDGSILFDGIDLMQTFDRFLVKQRMVILNVVLAITARTIPPSWFCVARKRRRLNGHDVSRVSVMHRWIGTCCMLTVRMNMPSKCVICYNYYSKLKVPAARGRGDWYSNSCWLDVMVQRFDSRLRVRWRRTVRLIVAATFSRRPAFLATKITCRSRLLYRRLHLDGDVTNSSSYPKP